MLDQEQVQAAKKEEVLNALTRMASTFRTRIGESLTSIASHNTPLAEATTPSLEALQAYTKGWTVFASSGAMAALPFFQRATGLGFRLHAVCARFAGMVRQTVTANPELFLPMFLLFVWQITAIAVKPQTLGLTVLLTLLLLVYGYRVLGKTPWLRRLGWVSPRQGFWLYSVLSGLASSAGVWSIARSFHESLGAVPPPHRVLLASASGPMLEEMLFRGLLFWLVFELLSRCRVSKLAAVSATILVIAVGFAFSHAGRTGLSLYTTILTGVAFGWMRAQSESTAAAALMHAVYNLVLSYLATF